MAHSKFYGYTPKQSKTSGKEGTMYSGAEEGNTYEHLGDRLDRVNPYEFKKGMDYELTAIGCSRLQESTKEEREKATETILNNLEKTPNYYTSLITYETLFRNVQGSKPSFTSWLKEQENVHMQEVNRGDKDSKHKDDKMTEPKYDKKEYTQSFGKTKALKEAIKNQIRKSLKEQVDLDLDSKEADKAATKAAKKASKGKKGKKGEPKKSSNRFDDEIKAIEKLLWKGNEEGSEHDKKEPHTESLIGIKNSAFDSHKQQRADGKEDIEDWKSKLKELNDSEGIKSIEDHIKEWGPKTKENPKAAGNNVKEGDLKGDDFFQTIKKFEQRIEAIKKEKEEDIKKRYLETRDLAQYQMERGDHIRLLEIIREKGISLREGAMGVQTYYEIAKASYLEGLSKGLGL